MTNQKLIRPLIVISFAGYIIYLLVVIAIHSYCELLGILLPIIPLLPGISWFSNRVLILILSIAAASTVVIIGIMQGIGTGEYENNFFEICIVLLIIVIFTAYKFKALVDETQIRLAQKKLLRMQKNESSLFDNYCGFIFLIDRKTKIVG